MPENEFTGEHRGACISCGFLNDTFPAMQPKEMGIGSRRRGEGNMDLHCFRAPISGVNLTQELLDAGANTAHNAGDAIARSEAFLRVLKKIRGDHGCPAWFEYVPTYDPQWHYNRWRDMDAERQRRDWEALLENRNNEFLAGLDRERRAWEKEAGKWPGRLIWAAAILAFGQVVAAVLALPLIARLLHLD